MSTVPAPHRLWGTPHLGNAMKIKSPPLHRQPNLFETNIAPVRWKDLPPTVQKGLLNQLREMLKSLPAQKLIAARKEGSHE